MKKWSTGFLLLCLTLLVGACAPHAQTPSSTIAPPTLTAEPVPTFIEESVRTELTIPRGAPAAIDGEIAAGEWEDAAALELSDGGLLYLKYGEGALYMAVDGLVHGTVNLGILKDGELWILHSSAALGSLVFKPDEDGWILKKNWVWCCRARSTGTEEENLLADEAWLSHNQFVGNELQTEYKIRIPKDEIFLSITYIFRDGSGAAYWPENLEEKDLLQFSTPPQVGDRALFSDDGWVKIFVSD